MISTFSSSFEHDLRCVLKGEVVYLPEGAVVFSRAAGRCLPGWKSGALVEVLRWVDPGMLWVKCLCCGEEAPVTSSTKVMRFEE
jgi:hypothetical protein